VSSLAAQHISYAVLTAPPEPPEGLYELLCAAFDEPPYEDVPAKMRKRMEAWPDFAAAPGFRLVLADAGDRLVGACWGWDSAVGSDDPPPLFAGLYRLLAERGDAGRLVGTEVVELAVDPCARGAGVAQGLLDRLLGGRPGWLLADANAPAHGWYERRGWVELGSVRPESPYVLMVTSRPV
jgi:GNAT superfamily N-acetyltransferase